MLRLYFCSVNFTSLVLACVDIVLRTVINSLNISTRNVVLSKCANFCAACGWWGANDAAQTALAMNEEVEQALFSLRY